MTVISDIDEDGINKNLQARYSKDLIYVSFFFFTFVMRTHAYIKTIPIPKRLWK